MTSLIGTTVRIDGHDWRIETLTYTPRTGTFFSLSSADGSVRAYLEDELKRLMGGANE